MLSLSKLCRVNSSSDQRWELHTRPIVIWMGAVLGISFALAALAEGTAVRTERPDWIPNGTGL